jgi:endonuclease/exonuclease/phosphatase family metal-dependent hydrolase
MKNLYFNTQFYKKVVMAFAVVFIAAGCSTSEPEIEEESSGRSLTLMTWNVHNLFDGKDNGYEYNEFLEAAGWSTEKYLGRINSISAAIDSINPKPNFIILQEIESLAVLEDIAYSLSGNYKYSHFANNPGMALGLGVISCLPLSDCKVHSITIDGETTPRPALETRLDTNEGSFVVFACHWKSKLGDDVATENVRKSSARVIIRRIRELWKNEPDLGIIVSGDLNENYDEFYRKNASMICALTPDDIYCASLTGQQKDFLIISINNPPSPVYFPNDSIVFFSPWTNELEKGSYYYKHNWETIDHFLVSAQFFNNKNWDYQMAAVANYPPFINSSGAPFAYNAKTGMGLSDHLPLLITLRAAPNEQY